MRHCRICNRNYADDDSFCAVDGSMLQMGPSPEYPVPVPHQPSAPPPTPDKATGSNKAPRVPPAPTGEEKDG